MNSQKTPHTSPLRASYEASFLSSLDKRYREISRVHTTYVLQRINHATTMLIYGNYNMHALTH